MRNNQKKHIPYLYSGPALILIFGAVIYPILYCIYISFTNLNIYHWKSFDFIGIDNYIRVLTGLDAQFYVVLLRTVVWTAINLALQLFIGLGLAMLLNIEELKGRGIMRTLLIIPWAIPGYISALVWKGMFNYDFGIVNAILHSVGIPKIYWLTDPFFAMVACIVTNVWLATPFIMLVCSGALQSIDKTMYEAAELDGASGLSRFRFITFPLIKPVIMPAMIFTAFVTFKQFDIIYLMTGGLAGKTDVALTYAYNYAFNSRNHSISATFSVIIFLILLVLTFINMKMSKADKDIY